MAREPGTVASTFHVYRSPGREPDDAPIPSPSRGVLFSPLKRGVAWVLLLLAPPLLFNLVIFPPFFEGSPDLRFLPHLAAIQDGIAVLFLAALPIAVHHVLRCVRLAWAGLRLRAKVAYVAALLVALTAVVGLAEAALLVSRGGIQLFEPSYQTSFAGPDGRRAYLYSGGFGCDYEVFVAEPYALTMRRVVKVSRNQCEATTPQVTWNADFTLDLIGHDGAPLKSQSWGLSWGFGGC